MSFREAWALRSRGLERTVAPVLALVLVPKRPVRRPVLLRPSLAVLAVWCCMPVAVCCCFVLLLLPPILFFPPLPCRVQTGEIYDVRRPLFYVYTPPRHCPGRLAFGHHYKRAMYEPHLVGARGRGGGGRGSLSRRVFEFARYAGVYLLLLRCNSMRRVS